MITSPDFKKVINSINPSKRQSYWNYFDAYQNVTPKLYSITEKELKAEIAAIKSGNELYIDSQIVISKVLTRLGSKHNFHRQFSESFSGLDRGQVLGMQLYSIMLQDNLIWVYKETQHYGHKFPHATYFIPKNKTSEYMNLYQSHEYILKLKMATC